MKRMQIIGLALVAVFAFSAVAVASASAASNNPQWEVAHTLLLKGETRAIEAVAVGNQELITEKTLITAEIDIVCTGYTLTAANIIGGENALAGTSEETITYSGCTVKGFPKCNVKSGTEVAGKIKTEPLTDETYYENEAAANAEKEPYVTLFKPKAGKVFVALKVEKATGGECPKNDEGEHKVEGQVLVRGPEGGVPKVEHELVAPAAALTSYWKNVSGVATKETVETLKVSGLANSKYVGVSKVKLASGAEWNSTK